MNHGIGGRHGLDDEGGCEVAHEGEKDDDDGREEPTWKQDRNEDWLFFLSLFLLNLVVEIYLPASWKAAGRVKAPVPTIRLKM